MGALSGRAAVVTGASHGLGLEIARAFVEAGARVLICARNAEALEQARSELGVDALTADVSKPEDAAHVVAAALDRLGGLDVLVNNAGVYGPIGPLAEVDWAEWTRAFEINLYGSVLMARAALPGLQTQGSGKIIQISGGGATAPLPRFSAYAASKAAVVRFTETLAEETRGTGIDVNAIAPGALNTRLLDQVLAAGPERAGSDFHARAVRQQAEGGAEPRRAAELAVFLASPESDGITGRLVSALWDPWQQLPAHRDELAGSDVYTLRRIVPEDRGLSW